jgi:hypothetical protein
VQLAIAGDFELAHPSTQWQQLAWHAVRLREPSDGMFVRTTRSVESAAVHVGQQKIELALR